MSAAIRKKLLLLFVSAALSLGALEWLIRIFLPHYDPRRQIEFEMMPDYLNAAVGPAGQTIRQRTPKGDYDLWIPFNVHGFRDTNDFRSATAEDWFAVGDSFTFGWGVEAGERFSDRLAARKGIRFFNIASPGDLLQYEGFVRYARDRGAPAGRTLVGVCMNNDLKNYETSEKVQPAIYGDRQRWKARLRARLKSHSALYLACSYELQRIPALRRAFERLGISRDINELTLQNLYDEAVLESSAQRAADLADAIGPERTWFVLIPSLALWLGDNQETERRIHDEFARRLDARGLRVLDLKPAFDASGRARSFYFETDAHWNADGHAFAAEQLAAWLP